MYLAGAAARRERTRAKKSESESEKEGENERERKREPSIAKENNYPSTVRVSCRTAVDQNQHRLPRPRLFLLLVLSAQSTERVTSPLSRAYRIDGITDSVLLRQFILTFSPGYLKYK